MAVRSCEVVCAVTLDAVGIRGNCHNSWADGWVLQEWRRGVAVAAFVAMHRHRIVGRMAADTERCVEDMAKACQ